MLEEKETQSIKKERKKSENQKLVQSKERKLKKRKQILTSASSCLSTPWK